MSASTSYLDVDRRPPPDRLRSPPAVVERGEADGEHLLRAVASELVSLAGPIAAAASVVNALASPASPHVQENALRPCLPPKPLVYLALLPRLVSAELAPEVFGEIQHFHVRLGHARRSALAYVAGAGTPPFKGGVHLEVLAGSWRDVCDAAIGLIDVLASETVRASGVRWAGGLARCDASLRRAADGGWPCLMQDGSVEVPGLAERRRHERYTVLWPAAMLRGGAMLAVRIDNVSEGGLGIRSEVSVRIGEQVIVELMGRMISGHVIWTAARRFGVGLAVPLSSDDPIVAAARAV